MADPLSVSAGIIAVVTFSLQTTTALLEAIDQFKRAPSSIRQLVEELHALRAVLGELQTTAHADSFTALELPLKQCGKACQEFQDLLSRRSGPSAGARARFDDWLLLRWHGTDINGFKETITGYKATITIALCNVNLCVPHFPHRVVGADCYRRSSQITRNVFEQYKDMITQTTLDLDQRLREINEQLRLLVQCDHRPGQEDGVPSGQREEEVPPYGEMKEEQESILKCLEICHYVAHNIEMLQQQLPAGGLAPARAPPAPPTLLAAADGLTGYGSQLEEQLRKLKETLRRRSGAANPPAAEEAELMQDIENVERNLEICNTAAQEAEQNRANVYTEVTSADDSHQIIVSTLGQLIHASKIKTGARSKQVFGQMSDASLQHVMPHGEPAAASKNVYEPETNKNASGTITVFEQRYGAARSLSSPQVDEKPRLDSARPA